MTKRLISFLLCFAMILGLVPFQASAVTQVRGDFLQPVRQITQEDMIPTGYVPIYTEADLRAIEKDPAGLYILMEDIEITSMEILCSNDAPFAGVLEGNGHTISGIEIMITGKNTSNYYWGLFSTLDGARIANLKVSGSLTLTIDESGRSNTCYIGGIAGLAQGNVNIVNCVNDVAISHGPEDGFKNQGTGGIVGGYIGSAGDSANFKNCRNMADTYSVYYTGGIVGYCDLNSSDLNITGCRNNATVSTREAALIGAYTGGIVGYLTTDYYSVARITACMNTGSIDARLCSGGIVANHGGTYSSSKGSPEVYISSCGNTGNVSAQEESAGIIVRASENCHISDCINTGTVKSGASQVDYAGIVGDVKEPVIRCINIGDVLSGSYNAAIACTVTATDQTPEEMLSTCYWLEGGSTNTLYRGNFWSGWPGITENGKLTAEEMKQEDTFVGYDFPAVWTMDEERGHPFPTALLELTLKNTYESTYIENTIAFADDSYRYQRIFEGSGDGSFAGVVAETYKKAGLDKANGLWNGMQFVEGLANYTLEPVTGYDVLLADLIGGSVSRNIRDEHITTAALSMFSEVITAAGAGLDAANVLKTEKFLADMAELPTIFGDPAKTLLDTVRNTVLKDIPYDDFTGSLSAVGGVVNVAGATAAGCDSVDEVFDFYVLCNANADTVRTYGDVIRDSAVRAASYDAKEGSKLIASANEFVNTMQNNLKGNPAALYDAVGGAVGDLLGVTGFTVLETVLKVKELNPVLSALDGVKTGITVGMPVADALTNMDKIAYYGTMLDLCGTLAKGMFAEVQARRDTFAHSQTFEDAQALNVAATLYLNLQILACDYAIGYCNAIVCGGVGGATRFDRDEITATVSVLAYKAELMQLQINGEHIAVGEDGSISGFIAKCPVTVTVKDGSGAALSKLETGAISGDERYAGDFMLLGDSGEHKAGFFDPEKHSVTFEGEGDGTMDLIVYGSENGVVTRIDYYADVPVEEGITYMLAPTGLQGDTLIPPTSTEEYDTDVHEHTEQILPEKEATCTATGLTEGKQCAECGEILVAQKEIPVTAHTYDDNVDGTCNSCSINRETVETRQVTHMFRMYNPNTGEHFYTGSEVEKGNLVAVGWQYEGIGFTFPANTGAPVHRLFHEPTGEHLYTMNETEKVTLMAEGWNYEGVAFNSAYNTEAVQHRLHNPNATVGAYHFTFSEEEMNNLITAGWEYQGIGWYSCWK